jgi:hypothetical protein
LREFKEIEISRQSCKGDCEKQGGKLLRLWSGFCPRIQPLEREGEGAEGEGAGKGGMGPRGLEPIFYQTYCFHFFPLPSYSPQTGTQRKEKSTLTSSNGGSRITKEQRVSLRVTRVRGLAVFILHISRNDWLM